MCGHRQDPVSHLDDVVNLMLTMLRLRVTLCQAGSLAALISLKSDAFNHMTSPQQDISLSRWPMFTIDSQDMD